MEIGIVSRIEGDEYIVCNAVSPENSLHAEDVFELKSTYCYEVYKEQKVLAFSSVGTMKEMKDHPVYINMKLESYISAPIYINNELFGTLNFSSTQTRPNHFSETERELISMMAKSIGNFLNLQNKEQDLLAANRRMKTLVGHVAHDLRNPLGNIFSLAQLSSSSDTTSEEREIYIQKIEDVAR